MLISPMEQSPPHALSKPQHGSVVAPPSLPPASPPQSSPIATGCDGEPSSSGALTRRHTVALPRAPPSPTPTQPLLSARRGPSLSAPDLPPLDFSALCSSAASPTPCTARRNVDAITSNLSGVRPFLFVTGVQAARSLAKLREAGITHILNVAGATANNFHEASPQFTYLKLCPRDDASEDISALLDVTTAFIDSARASSPAARVAVHCHMGVSRSATVAIAYMIMAEGLSLEAAMADMRRARPIADPNTSFLLALEDLSRRVRLGRPRAVLFRVQPHRCGAVGNSILALSSTSSSAQDEPLLVASPQAPGAVMDTAHVWILAHRVRDGFEVLCGPDAPPAHFERAVALANTFARHEERYEAMYPVARGHACGPSTPPLQCPVLVLGPEQWSLNAIQRFKAALQSSL